MMDSRIRIAGIVEESIVDGPGIRLVVFAQGCPHHCPGCHNPETHAYEGGKSVAIAEILQRLAMNPLLDGITLSGGEPFAQAAGFALLAQSARQRGFHVMTYSGYTYEELTASSEQNPAWALLLEQTDLLVDGPFQLAERNLLLPFRGSENQRVIDVQESLRQGKVVLASV
ncbi:anaerobic ribonucleoside-triphosphate reductase activating protein [Desulfitobacterium hafniense]|uniref:anaerobic ribonucleoside-triphosphate reductase activating protein n=1 Tax=Desulfitobacterium hafniense TaxID=49338 RepID=UPI0003826DDE|nr:anaerobic ribonucleoside-triphosphate reductase activating protein [Desulfitobacterium hafniense]